MKDSIEKLSKLLNKKEKGKFVLLLFLMLLAALLETMGIGLIVPFVSIVTNPELIHKQQFLSYIYVLFNFKSENEFILLSVGTLLLVFIIKNIYLVLFNYLQNKIILNQQVKLSRELFKAYLTKPYKFHLERNSADLYRNVTGEVSKVYQGIIMSSFQLLTEILVITCILGLIFTTAPTATLAACIILGGSIILFFRIFRKKINELGQEQQMVSAMMIKWVNQGLGASKEIKVNGKEKYFISAYTKQSQISINNNVYMRLLDIIPRYTIETILVSTVLIMMLIIIHQGKNAGELVSTMALFAMAAFRLMPSISRVIGLITSIRYSKPGLDIVYQDLFLIKGDLDDNKDVDVPLFEPLNVKTRYFNDSIELKDVSFRYPNQKDWSIKDISLKIPIGQSVAFIGESGAGKTTVVDIILGLFSPEKGNILVDGKKLIEEKINWQKKIGYIPQSIFLSDDTIRSNVAFGIDGDLIDDKEVWRALEQAKLKEFVEGLPQKLDTSVGERGVRLSGGQRQRIGIARALYHNPEILVMDEATSALDSDTERQIMSAIDSLKGDKTLIIIAHRLSTIENCDIVYKINKGKLVSLNKKLERSS
ncbi:ABC transporter ATP-binding protein [Neobacillus vireti]|uniref:ABC transporter ATP-binding protein n=1 Tax=Neobacillus vireti TaxID=220686 RepID=UPI002FFDD0B8